MLDVLRELAEKNEKKIVLLVMDGLGGLPAEPGGRTELETARTPHLDALAAESECGLHVPVGFGITPGSAPGHLALFGYTPTDFPIGRGVVAALGIGFELKARDVAARVNFASRDEEGRITDRRAGRIPTVIFRGEGLSDHVEDTDPQATGVRPHDPTPTSEEGKRTAEVTAEFLRQALKLLEDRHPANAVLMRGFAELPHIPSMRELYGLTPVALATYPDYKGVSRLCGMDIVEGLNSLQQQGQALRENWDSHDFFFVHHKYADSRGEDGDFDAKVAEIEKVDAFLPQITALRPDVLIVTGDHSTPAVMKAHSSHPIPFLIHAANIRPDGVDSFGERSCASGLWGVVPGTTLIRLALAYAGKLAKYGA
jgi:2,3-bisphosphoglycerate-independent phosphoglycerate mutase